MMNGLRDHFAHAGYDAEEFYFYQLNQEKIEKLRVIWKGKLRLVHSAERREDAKPDRREMPGAFERKKAG
jgi:hypothetical protein